MTKVFTLGLITAVALLMSGCAVKVGNETLGKVEKTQIDSTIVKGKSTKEDIKTFMGDTDKTDFDNNGNEKWVYTHVRKEAKFTNYIPIVDLFARGTNDTTKTLVVLFDDRGIVKNYIASDAKGETKGGLFQ
jgi:outer membrane protein assembly factor BamE (lipoprotein component of BamABCDE complex)